LNDAFLSRAAYVASDGKLFASDSEGCEGKRLLPLYCLSQHSSMETEEEQDVYYNAFLGRDLNPGLGMPTVTLTFESQQSVINVRF
jgi:hypothetical protein